MTHGTVPPMVNEPAKSKKLKVKDLVINTEGAKKAKQNAMKRQLRKHQNGGASDPIKAMYKAKGEKMPTTKKTLKYVSKNSSGYNAPKSAVDTSVWKERPGRTPDSKTYQKGGTTKPTPKRTTVPKKYVDSAIPTYKGPDAPMPKTARAQNGGTTKKMKTGGMVNANANLVATKSAGSKGVKPGVNPKAAASKRATGRVGGTSAAPKTALPKAQMGGSAYTPGNQPGGTPKVGGYKPKSDYTPGNQPGGTPRAGGAKLTPTAGGSKKSFKKFIKKGRA
jgi:hypothetical protein